MVLFLVKLHATVFDLSSSCQCFLLCRIPGCVWLSVDINDWLLSEVGPVDDLFISVLLHDGLQDLIETGKGGLTGTKHWKAGHLQDGVKVRFAKIWTSAYST